MKIKNTIIALTLSAIMSTASFADGLSDAFNDIRTQAVDAGVYRSKTRTTVTMGSFNARVPTTSFNLISYTPPRFSAGCGGIDAHFGGFSFVNGIDFQQLVENVAQNALGLVIHLAIEVGCPVCSEKIAEIQGWIQKAAEFSVDSCMAAKSIIKAGTSALDICQASAGKCSSSGVGGDGVECQKSCATEISSWTTYQDIYGKETDPAGPSMEKPNRPDPICQTGNKAWCLLTNIELLPVKDETNAGIQSKRPKTPAEAAAVSDDELTKLAFGELIMALIGIADLNLDPLKDDLATKTKKIVNNKAHIKSIYKFAVCGVSPHTDASVVEIIRPNCQGAWDESAFRTISVCNPANIEEYKLCTTSTTMTIADWAVARDFFPDGGLYGQVAKVLKDASVKLQTKTSDLTANEKAVIQSAPIPLYQLLNLSATYPEIQSDIIGPSAMLLADMIAHQYFEEKLTEITQNATMRNIDTADIKVIKDSLDEFLEPLRSAQLTSYASNAKSNQRAFTQMLVSNIQMYQSLLVRDIADKQFGANIEASTKSLASFKQSGTP